MKWQVELMENRWFSRAPKRHLRERRGGRWRGMRLRMGGGLQRPLLPSPTAPSRPSRATLSSCRWCSVQPQSSKWHFSFVFYVSGCSLPRELWLSLMSPHLPSSCFFFLCFFFHHSIVLREWTDKRRRFTDRKVSKDLEKLGTVISLFFLREFQQILGIFLKLDNYRVWIKSRLLLDPYSYLMFV